eukprot:ANDGO_03334.mRNA.1 hypothetical protein
MMRFSVVVCVLAFACILSCVDAGIPESIDRAMHAYWGHSTAAGPDGGVEACAWAVNNIISDAGLRKIGSNTNYVPSVVDALKGGRGEAIHAKDAVAGDLAIACGEKHIGICASGGCGTIDSNSSSRKCFCWSATYSEFSSYFGCEPAIFRVRN